MVIDLHDFFTIIVIIIIYTSLGLKLYVLRLNIDEHYLYVAFRGVGQNRSQSYSFIFMKTLNKIKSY